MPSKAKAPAKQPAAKATKKPVAAKAAEKDAETAKPAEFAAGKSFNFKFRGNEYTNAKVLEVGSGGSLVIQSDRLPNPEQIEKGEVTDLTAA